MEVLTGMTFRLRASRDERFRIWQRFRNFLFIIVLVTSSGKSGNGLHTVLEATTVCPMR